MTPINSASDKIPGSGQVLDPATAATSRSLWREAHRLRDSLDFRPASHAKYAVHTPHAEGKPLYCSVSGLNDCGTYRARPSGILAIIADAAWAAPSTEAALEVVDNRLFGHHAALFAATRSA